MLFKYRVALIFNFIFVLVFIGCNKAAPIQSSSLKSVKTDLNQPGSPGETATIIDKPVTFYFEAEEDKLYDGANRLAASLHEMNNVRDVNLLGIEKEMLFVGLHPEKLIRLNIADLELIMKQIEASSSVELKDVEVLKYNGNSIFVKDLAEVYETKESPVSTFWHNGKRIGLFKVFPNGGIKTKELIDKIKTEIELHVGESVIFPSVDYPQIILVLETTASVDEQVISVINSGLEDASLGEVPRLFKISDFQKSSNGLNGLQINKRVSVELQPLIFQKLDIEKKIAAFINRDFKGRSVEIVDVKGVSNISLKIENINDKDMERIGKSFLSEFNETDSDFYFFQHSPRYKQELVIHVDEQLLQAYNMDNVTFNQFVAAVTGGLYGTFKREKENVKFKLFIDIEKDNVDDLLQIVIPARDGSWIPLAQLANVKSGYTIDTNYSNQLIFKGVVPLSKQNMAKTMIEKWLKKNNLTKQGTFVSGN